MLIFIAPHSLQWSMDASKSQLDSENRRDGRHDQCDARKKQQDENDLPRHRPRMATADSSAAHAAVSRPRCLGKKKTKKKKKELCRGGGVGVGVLSALL